jgi:hypothetical protein
VGVAWEGVMLIRLDIEIWGVAKVVLKMEIVKTSGWVSEVVWRLLGFMALVCV